ncbi:MAG: hypothetical protein ABL986_13040 [Vicinamibacterales bacterium]
MHTLTHGETYHPTPSFLRLPRWRWGKLAAVRAELEEARGELARLEQELVVRDAARQDTASAHAAEVLLQTTRADARLEDSRRQCDVALRELSAATRAAADVAEQHATTLAAMRVDLDAAEARAAQLEQALPLHVEAVRREAATAHEAAVWALTTHAATELDAARRDAADALAAQATRLEAQAAAQVAAAVRTYQGEAADALAGTVKQHNAAIAAVRAELEDVEKRRSRLELDLPAAVDLARQEEKAAHAAQMAVLEEQAEARLASTRRDAETALALLAEELDARASTHLETTLRTARDEAGRAAAAVAQQHAGELGAMRAQLEDVEKRRATLERDLPVQVEAARREAGAAHANELTALRAHATAQIEAAVREAREDAAQAEAKAARRHVAAFAKLRGQREETEARATRLEQDLNIELVRRREAGVAHAAELAVLQAQAEARVEAAVREARDEAARAASEVAQQHATSLALMQVDLDASEARRVQGERDTGLQVEAARRDAHAAHATEVAALRTQATAQVEVAMREAHDEAARAAAEAELRHAEALGALRYELEDAEARRMRIEQDLALHVVLRREASTAHAAEIAALRAQAAAQVEAAENQAREDASRAAAHMTAQHALALEALRAELEQSEARLAKLEGDLLSDIDAVRRDAEARHSTAVAALKAQAAAQIESAVREAREEAARAVVHPSRGEDAELDDEQLAALMGIPALPVRQGSTLAQMAVVTGALIVSGAAGSLVGWSVAVWGLL